MATPTYYERLGVEADCTPELLKRAYHAAVLHHHPDKQAAGASADFSKEFTESTFQLVHEAYQVLRDVESRRRYDQSLQEKKLRSELRVSDEVALEDFEFDAEDEIYTYNCRCGESYVLTTDEVDDAVEIVPCDGCSLNIRVLYTHATT
ncbi:Aste57867_16026 [Aphanomyces stellatus]|uniref:Aste57867_16026 protein n=1 Tax=Aphanomyces stellatus TaxID=120398 RepID=A0A485L5H2_9STRA|nr:hypothetical protein As57867_015970 [Aphanomyces stellatus]VFT92811.1 Aste57867_16026 [Aphanomyces stellatus]